MKLNKKLLWGSLILLITFNIANFLNLIFQFSMARFLSVADYGILATLTSLIYIFSIFSQSIQTVITKYSSIESSDSKLKNLLSKTLNKSTRISILIFLVYLLIAIALMFVLQISYSLMVLIGIMIFTAFLMPITRGMLQGTKKFRALGINMIIDPLVKLIIGISLVLLGWKVYGAVSGIVIGSIFAFTFSFLPLKSILKSSTEKINLPEIYSYTKPVFIAVFSIMVFYSIDVIIAKIFFSPDVAGAYAISSTLAKIIFLGTQPLSRAMFPLSSEKSKDKTHSKNIFQNSILIILGMIIPALIIIYFFPNTIVNLFSGKIIPKSENILILLGIGISLFSLTNLNIFYKLSIGKTKGCKYLPVFIIVEIVLLSIFHGSLQQFSIAYIVASAIFLVGSIVLLRK